MEAGRKLAYKKFEKEREEAKKSSTEEKGKPDFDKPKD